MDEEQEKVILEEIRSMKYLPYAIELISVDGDTYTLRNDWGNIIIYIKKGDKYFLKEDVEMEEKK